MDRDAWVLLLGILIPILYDITKPWIKSYLDKGSLTLRQRERDVLLLQYRARRIEHGSLDVIHTVAFRGIITGLIQLSILIIIIGVNVLASPMAQALLHLSITARFLLLWLIQSKSLLFITNGEMKRHC